VWRRRGEPAALVKQLSSLCITDTRPPLPVDEGGAPCQGRDAQVSPPSMQSKRMIMKTLMFALVAMAVLAGIAAPASAAALDGCPPGYGQAYDTCVRVLP
jgi:hypothetical protein